MYPNFCLIIFICRNKKFKLSLFIQFRLEDLYHLKIICFRSKLFQNKDKIKYKNYYNSDEIL